MEHFLHASPPFTFSAVFQRFLAGDAAGPPFLGGRIRGHPCHVGGVVGAGVFEITEQVMLAVVELAQVDRVVPDIAVLDHFQHIRPDGGVELFVFVDFVGVQCDDGSVAFHV